MKKELHQSAYIVTGTNRGIGKGLADEIVRRGHLLFSVSRGPETHQGARRHYMCDLRDVDASRRVMVQIMRDVPHASCRETVLVNNAGVLEPLGFLENHAPDAIADAVGVNLTAVAILMSLFIRESSAWPGSRRIINISSGAASHSYPGWSIYCATKAALNMLTQCAAAEQRERPNGVCVVAVAPGVVDTRMQTLIRNAAESDFPSRPRFVKMKEEGRLADPSQIAALLLDLDSGAKFESGGIYDLRKVQWHEGAAHIAPIS
jgi:benzil reductase ((S)-benzoin forming)